MSINMHEQASSEQPCVIVVDDALPEIQSEIERMRRLAETAPLISTDPERVYAILEKIKEALETGWLAEPVDY